MNELPSSAGASTQMSARASRRFGSKRMRWSAALVCAALIGITGASAGTTSATEHPADTTAFNFDTGNAATDVIFPFTEAPVTKDISPWGGDATLIFRVAAMVECSWFDAIAPYHPTAVGIYSDLGRRPASEAVTNKDKNIAMLYATYRVLENLLPQEDATWRRMLTSVGLDPDDAQENTTTPIGIGNLAGRKVVEARVHDGMNQLGDEGGRKYNPEPYADYTGYKPVNTPYELKDPSRWQPAMSSNGEGIFKSQVFVTPQLAVTQPFTYSDPSKFLVAPPVNSDVHNWTQYKKQADQILAASAALDDESKMKAEFFNDKFLAFGRGTLGVMGAPNISLDDFVFRFAAMNVGGFDDLIAAWVNKYKYDAVRPFSAISYIYGDKPVTAWGGPGKGTVTDLPGNQWRSYMPVSDHPEYPSGSTSLCATLAELGRQFKGTDAIDVSFDWPKGSSSVEPGITPSTDLTLHWSTGTAFENDCGQARIDAGVHFPSAVAAAKGMGHKVADTVAAFFKAHIAGTMGPQPPADR